MVHFQAITFAFASTSSPYETDVPVTCAKTFTMRHKLSNFHLIFKIEIGMKMK